MRLSSDPSHPDYHHAAHFCKVFLEGAERDGVLAADEEGRHALLEQRDTRGHPVFNKAGGLCADHFYGHVRIEVPEALRYFFEAPPT